MFDGGCRRFLVGLGALAAPLFLLACEEENTYVPPPLPKVTVALPLIQEVTEYLEFTGTTAAYAQVEVPARVPGVLTSMHFEPGTPVDAGDLLFTIDPKDYQAQVQAAEAELEQAEAREIETGKTLGRSETLAERGNVSQAKVDEAQADHSSAKAEVLVRRGQPDSGPDQPRLYRGASANLRAGGAEPGGCGKSGRSGRSDDSDRHHDLRPDLCLFRRERARSPARHVDGVERKTPTKVAPASASRRR